MSATIWNPNDNYLAQSNATGTVKQEAQVATAAQVSFILTTFSFVANTGSLFVYKNGSILTRGADYTEVSNTGITLAVAATAGDKFLFIGFVGITGLSVLDTVLRAELSTSGGAGILGFSHANIYAAGSVGSKLKKIVHVTDAPYSAIGGGVIDDTAAIQAALNSGATRVVIPAGFTFGVTGLVLVAGQTLQLDGVLKKLSGVNATISVASNCKVIGNGEINGNSIVCNGIVGSNTQNVRVQGLYLRNINGVGIASYSVGSNTWDILDNRIETTTNEAIVVEYTDNCLIANNRIKTGLHGIRWWGGDSNVSTTVGIRALRIIGNTVSGVMGGIWGSLGANITVTGNYVDTCSDVGIDFEGCSDFTCSGNTAYECANGCYAVFYGCSQGTFSGNVARNTVSNGAAFYATTNLIYTNTNLLIVNNVFATKTACISATSNDNRSFSNSDIRGNQLLCTGGQSAISIFRNRNLRISDNHILTLNSATGIKLTGVNFSIVSNNTITGNNDTSVSPVAAGGILFVSQSAAYPCGYNSVCDNRIDSHVYSITDNSAADLTQSQNNIRRNAVSNVYRSVGAAYNGVILDNFNFNAPGTAVAATTF